VFIVGYTLTTYGSPPVGTNIDWVQGIYEHRTSTNYAIWLRSGSDIAVSTPPNLIDAYTTADVSTGSEYQMRVRYDRDVTVASATNVGNYSLASFGTVNSAVMDGTSNVILDVTNGLAHGATETVTCNNITGLMNGLSMTSPQSWTFINGVLTVRECSAPNPDSLLGTPCTDRSRFAGAGGQVSQGTPGTRMTFAGVCCGVYGSLTEYMDADRSITGDHGGLSAYGLPVTPTLGHKYTIAGQLQEFYGETEVYLPVYEVDQGAATLPAPIDLTVKTVSLDTCEVSNAGWGDDPPPPSAVLSGEDFESMLVRLDYVKAVGTNLSYGWHVTGPDPAFTDTMICENFYGALGANLATNPLYPPTGDVLTITGCVHYDAGFVVCPRSAADIIDHGANVSVPVGPKALSFAVYPNPTRRASLNFALPTATHVELGVYDVTGRLVASLWNGNMPAGEYTRLWNGHDASGKPVGAGVYFYRLRAGGETRTVRGVLLGN